MQRPENIWHIQLIQTNCMISSDDSLSVWKEKGKKSSKNMSITCKLLIITKSMVKKKNIENPREFIQLAI